MCLCGSCDYSALNEDIVRSRCGGGEVIYPFMYIFCETFSIFQFCIVFLFGFGEFLCCCDWFLIFDSLVASLYMGRACMMEHLSVMLFSVSHNNPISHVRFCAYLIHLTIDFWC